MAELGPTPPSPLSAVADALARDGVRTTTSSILSGGYLNYVWRVGVDDDDSSPSPPSGHPRLLPRPLPPTLVVKCHPPFIASKPDVPFSSTRGPFEGQVLEFVARSLWGPDGVAPLPPSPPSTSVPSVRVPRLLASLPNLRPAPALLLEDVGRDALTLEDWLVSFAEAHHRHHGAPASAAGRALGLALGQLHAGSFLLGRGAGADAAVVTTMLNMPVQRMRRDVQYRAVGAAVLLAAARTGTTTSSPAPEVNATRVAAFSAACAALGDVYAESPGFCLIHGDLWARSVLVAPEPLQGFSPSPSCPPLVVIDWELAHWGSPAQDVAHFASHLWMLHAALQPTGPEGLRTGEVRDGRGGPPDDPLVPRPPPLFGALEGALRFDGDESPFSALWHAFLDAYRGAIAACLADEAAAAREAWEKAWEGRSATRTATTQAAGPPRMPVEAQALIHAGAEIGARLGVFRDGGPFDVGRWEQRQVGAGGGTTMGRPVSRLVEFAAARACELAEAAAAGMRG
jgi:hypothetical protein